jgi:phage terminase large subunit
VVLKRAVKRVAAKSKEITLHKQQVKAITSSKRVTILCSGIQGGKTFCGSIWMRKRVSEIKGEHCNFIVTAPTVKIFHQATEPAFLEMFQGLGKYNRTKAEFDMGNNRKVFLRTMHVPEAIEGITNCYGIWADELGMYNSKAWINVEGRSAVKQAPIFGTTTPYALNWLYRDVYKQHREGKRDDVEFIQFRSVDNPYFPKEEFERQKRLLDPRVFEMKYCGQFRKMAGLVFMEFDDILNQIEPNTAWHDRELWRVFGGIDWGTTNPFAITIRAIHKYESKDYQIAEFYQSGLDPNEKLRIAQQFHKEFHVEQWYADNEAPDMIMLFNKAKLNTTAAPKYSGSLVDNISRHLAIIKTREHKLFHGKCKHTIDEYETYHYKEDDGKEINAPENPVDSNNHLMTANMYVTQCTEPIRERHRAIQTPALEGKTRLQKLLAGELYENQKTDDWYHG